MSHTVEPTPKARRHVLEELVRDSSLPPLSRLVWHVIAGHGTAKTGDVTAFPPSLAQIAHGAGLDRRTVIDHVNNLVKEGWLHRDPGGPGRKTRYRLSSPMDPSPPLVRPGAPSVATGAPSRTKVVRGDALDSAGQRTNIVRPGAPYPGSPGNPGSSSPPTPAPTQAIVAARAGVDDDEAEKIMDEIKRRHTPRSLSAYVRSMAPGDIVEIRNDLRAAAAAAVRSGPDYAAHTAAVANQPDCRHGQPGGDIPIPGTLWSPCASCRRLAGWTPDPKDTP